MEALSIFAHRCGYLSSTHLDPDVSSLRVLPGRKGGRSCCAPVSTNSVQGGGRISNSRSGSSSRFAKVSLYEPKMRSFTASFALAMALEDGVAESEGTDVEVDKVAILEEELSVRCESGAVNGGEKRIDVRALAQSLWDCRSADDVDQVFDEMRELPPPQVYSTMVIGLGMDKKVDSAVALVDWLRRKRKETDGVVGPNLFIYNSLLNALKQNRQFEIVDKVMEDMADEGILPNVVTYNSLMLIYVEQGKPDAALDVLDRIETEGLVPSPATYSTALLAHWKMGDAYGVLAFYVELRDKYARGLICGGMDENWEAEFDKLKDYTIRICHKMMRQWLVAGGDPTVNILKFLIAMDKDSIAMGRAEYERLLWACTEESHFCVAKEFYRRLRELDCGISLSVCNHVIWLMGKAKKWWAALEVYEDLLDKGPKPNNLSYELIMSHFNVLLDAARRRGIWRWGVRLIDKMQDKGLKLGSRQWNAVLVACSKASEASTAVQIFRRMIEQGEKPNILSYGALLSALEKAKLYDEALQVWEHMCKVGLKPNLHAYTILTSIYIGKGEPEKVDSVVHEMDSSGISPTVVTFNAIISGCARTNHASAAFEWFHRMMVRNIAPNKVTYDMLIECLALDGKPKLAYEMYHRALKEGFQLSSRAYDAVFYSCHRYGASVDLSAVGPRPAGRRNLADTTIRNRPYRRQEVYKPLAAGK